MVSVKEIKRVTCSVEEPIPNSLATESNARMGCSKKYLNKCDDELWPGIGDVLLPTGPLLMLDRIIDVQANGGKFGRGLAVAELDIDTSSWFFKYHFQNDPVMPGCFLIETFWQLVGVHLAWSGCSGRGRVLESGVTRFFDPVLCKRQTLRISVHIRKLKKIGNPICIANGEISSSDGLKCKAEAIKIGMLKLDY